MILDIPNAFTQTLVLKDKERIIIKIIKRLVKIILEINYESYTSFVYEGIRENFISKNYKDAI